MQRSFGLPLLALLSALLPAACGSSGAAPSQGDGGTVALSDGGAPSPDGAGDAQTAIDGGLDAPSGDGGGDASALVLPQVLSLTGTVVASPKLVAVTFPGDDQVTEINAFTKAVGGSAYWKAATSEYGVGPAVGETIAETEAAPGSIDQNAGDSETWLSTRFDGTHPEWGTFDPNAIYLVFYPSATTTTPSVGGCGGAYHNAIPITLPAITDGGVTDGGTDGGAGTKATLLYGIVFRCAQTIDVGRPTGVELTTAMASHEMVEAATDPRGDAYGSTGDAYFAWAYFFGGEVGDMCAFHPGVWIKPADIGHTVQRSWSNAAAAAFQDPCVPGASDPLFLAAPDGQQAITLLDGNGGKVSTQGFAVPKGQSKTIDVRLYGATTAPFTVSPFTYSMEHGLTDPYLQFSITPSSGSSGDVLHLTITRIADNGAGYGGDSVKLVSTQGTATNAWYFGVSN